jgi:CxxC-x17-CxxC domain-containing protein
VRPETRTNCSQCGAETTVPFKPTQGRPVLCRSCFKLQMAQQGPIPVLPPHPEPPLQQARTDGN